MSQNAVTIPASAVYLRDRYGGDFSESDATQTVGTAVVKLLANDPERVGLTIVNLGTDTVWIAPSDSVSDTAGIQLNAGGGIASLNIRDDATLVCRPWYAVAGSAGQSVYVLAVRRYNVGVSA